MFEVGSIHYLPPELCDGGRPTATADCSVTCVILANVRSKHRSKPPSDCFFLYDNLNWLVVSTPLTNISQLGLFFPKYGKVKNVPNHQPDRNEHLIKDIGCRFSYTLCTMLRKRLFEASKSARMLVSRMGLGCLQIHPCFIGLHATTKPKKHTLHEMQGSQQWYLIWTVHMSRSSMERLRRFILRHPKHNCSMSPSSRLKKGPRAPSMAHYLTHPSEVVSLRWAMEFVNYS